MSNITDKKILHTFLIEFIILGAIGIFIFSSHAYQDFCETMRHGLTVWNALFDGKLIDFYAYCGGNNGGIYCGSDMIGTYMDARYDFTIYVIFAIWNFPLWLIEHFRGGNIQNSFAAMLYAKSMLLAAVAVTGHLLILITRKITGGAQNNAGLILSYLSSCLLLASLLIIGQYDVLSLIFILAGVYFYLNDNRKYFLICFIIANSMKYFGLLYLLPLLCLKEKNPLKLIGQLALSMSLSIFWKIFFSFGTYGSAVLSNNDGLISMLTSYQLFSGVSIFWVSYLALVIHCYKRKDMSQARHYHEVIFAGFVTYMLLYTAAPAYPYWVVLLIPFMTIMLHTSGSLYGLNTWLTIMFESALLIKHYTWYSWCYSRVTYGNMLLYKLCPNKAVGAPDIGRYINYWIAKFPTWHIPVMLSTVFTAAGFSLILLNRPKEAGDSGDSALTYTQNPVLMRIRLAISLLILLIPDIYYIGVTSGVLKNMQP